MTRKSNWKASAFNKIMLKRSIIYSITLKAKIRSRRKWSEVKLIS